MVIDSNTFGFEALVCTTGYQWATAKFLGLSTAELREAALSARPEGLASHLAFLPPFLVELAPGGQVGELVTRRPTTNPALFRQFAELDPKNLGALAAFASEHGPLLGGWSGALWGRPAAVQIKFPTGAAAIRARRFSPEGSEQRGYENPREHKDIVEPITVWGHGIAGVALAVGLLDVLRDPDPTARVSTLRKIFAYDESLWYLEPDGLVSGLGLRTGLPGDAAPFIFARLGEFTPVERVATAYLLELVNAHLAEVSPVLVLDADGGVREVLRAQTLLEAIWTQVFAAITQNKLHRKCPSCGGWFELGGQDGATARRRYCSDRCRVRASEARKARAVELAGEGLTAAQIVARFAAEGHETDVATVKGWIKAKKGGK